MFSRWVKILTTLIKRWYSSPRLFAATTFLVLLVAFFARSIFSNTIPSPAIILQNNPLFSVTDEVPEEEGKYGLHGDVVFQMEPWFEHLKFSLSQGELPLWNPFQGMGHPHMANYQSGIFFPLNWLPVVFGWRWGLLLLYAGKLFLTGWFTFLFLRRLNLHRHAALVGGIGYMFSGFMVAWLYWPIAAQVFTLPLCLWLLEAIVLEPRNFRRYVHLSLGIGLSLLVGHPETFAHIALVCVTYFLVRIWARRFKWTVLWRVGLGSVLAGGVGLALAAVQILPFLEYLLQSSTWVVRSSMPNQSFMALRTLPLNIFPELAGNQTFPRPFMDFALPFTHINDVTGGFVGLTLTILAVLGVINFWRKTLVRYFLLLIIISLMIVYATPRFVFDAFVRLPLFDTNLNQRMLFIVSFSLSVLASIMVSALLKKSVSFISRRNVITLGFLIFALPIVYLGASYFFIPYISSQGWLPLAKYGVHLISYGVVLSLNLVGLIGIYLLGTKCRLWWVPLMLLIVLETGLRGLWMEPVTPPEMFRPETAATKFLEENLGTQRVLSLSGETDISPNLGTMYQFGDIRIYDALTLGEYIQAYAPHIGATGNLQAVLSANQKYINYSGVHLLIMRKADDITKLKELDTYKKNLRLVLESNDVEFYENIAAKNIAFFANSPSFLQNQEMTNSVVESVGLTANSIDVRVIMDKEEWLIFSSNSYPGWHVNVDNKSAALVPADLNFQAVLLEGGSHSVKLYYWPKSFITGIVISASSVVLAIILLILMKKSHNLGVTHYRKNLT